MVSKIIRLRTYAVRRLTRFRLLPYIHVDHHFDFDLEWLWFGVHTWLNTAWRVDNCKKCNAQFKNNDPDGYARRYP